ncbi:hypothetical protein J6590_043124 [Homalodisca vitripennis]|nr:hypothetical protein J6590_043124 [Homalodisca vitripennis]
MPPSPLLVCIPQVCASCARDATGFNFQLVVNLPLTTRREVHGPRSGGLPSRTKRPIVTSVRTLTKTVIFQSPTRQTARHLPSNMPPSPLLVCIPSPTRQTARHLPPTPPPPTNKPTHPTTNPTNTNTPPPPTNTTNTPNNKPPNTNTPPPPTNTTNTPNNKPHTPTPPRIPVSANS